MIAPIFCNGGEFSYQYNSSNFATNFFNRDVGPYVPIFRYMPYINCNYASPGTRGGSGYMVPHSINIAYADQSRKKENYADSEINISSRPKVESTPSSTSRTTVESPKTTKSKIRENPQTSTNPSQRPVRTTFVEIARKYSDCNEKNGTHHKFCVNPSCKQEDPYDQEWCTDFVTYVVKEAYRNAGREVPAGFGDHDVERMKNWADRNGLFIRTSNVARKGSFITKNIKPGDIFILNENNSSHIGFVTRVDDNGIIHTIEGNRDDKVSRFSYSPDNPDLSGFIRMP